MKKLANKVGQVGDYVFGNFLNKPSRQSDAQSSPAKRPSESIPTQISKRPRNDNGPRTLEVISVDGNSDTVEMDRSANSVGKRKMNHHGSQSLRSSESRHPTSAIDEYRSTSTHTGLQVSRKRSRHQKKGQVPASGSPEQDLGRHSTQEMATQPRFKTPGRPLISQSEQANDQIEDDGLVVITRPGTATGHGDASFKKATFAFIPDLSSEDELSEAAPRPSKTKMRDRMYQPTRPNEPRGNQANNGLKRSAGSPDVLQGAHPTKRRYEPSSEANITRTKFSAPALKGTRGRPEALRVRKVLCEPRFVYPAADTMPKGAEGASNAPCFLLPNDKGPYHFIVTDDKGAELETLGWITPNLARIRGIYHHSGSPIVRITSATGIDSNAKFSKGAATLIEFDSVQEANHCVDFYRRANTSIQVHTEDRSTLRTTMDERTKRIREWYLKQSSLPQDTQHATRQAEIRQRIRPNVDEPPFSEARQTGQMARLKTLRAHMRAGDEPGSNALDVAENNQDGELWEHENSQTDQAKRSSRRPPENQRNLRSVKPKPHSPTPSPPERWTEQNPNWIEERSYKIPLIYERTTISATDIERLDEGQFLNDEIISFYAKYLHKKLEARNEQVAKKVYLFSSFFWEKLRSSGYGGVKGWTTKVDVSTFDYIVVPINQSAHWYLAIICNPGALLPKEENTGQDDDPVNSAAAGQKDQDQVSAEGEAGNKIERVTSSLAHISFDEQQLDGSAAIDLDAPKATSSAKKSKSTRKGPGPKKYDPKDPRVIVLDSLDGAHSNVASILKSYLKDEIKQRKNVDITIPDRFGMAAKDIPFQNNFTDCGVYLLGYLEQFMKGPHEFTKKILQHENRDWDVNASATRNRIRDVIFDLQAEYCKELKRQKREKKLASKQKKAISQTPPAVLPASSPRIASEQPGETSSVTSSSVANTRQQTPAHALSSPKNQVEAGQIFDQRSPAVSPPPSQRKQASSSQAVVNSSPQPGSDNQVRHEKRQKSPNKQLVETRSTRVVDEKSPVLEDSSSSSSGSEVPDVGASMVVHLSQSMESNEAIHSQRDEQIASSQTVAESGRRGEPSASVSRCETAKVASDTGRFLTSSEIKGAQSSVEQDITPKLSMPKDSVQILAQTQPDSAGPSESPMPQGPPRPPEPPTMLDGNYDMRLFMKPIPSSSPSAASVSGSTNSRTASKWHSDRREASSIKASTQHSTTRQNGERSRYWPSSTEAPVRQDNSSQHTVVPSSSNDGSMAQGRAPSKEEGRRRTKLHEEKKALPKMKNEGKGKRSRSSPTIDLTTD